MIERLRNRHVLLAEDNATNQLIAAEMLRTLGAEVTLASDGEEALRLFGAARFDLALLDIEMPRLSGLDVIRTIRQISDDRAKTPLIALTAFVMEEHRSRIMDAGADGIIPKPLISIDDFGDAVATFLSAGLGATGSTDAGVLDAAAIRELQDILGDDAMQTLMSKVLVDLDSAEEAIRSALAPLDTTVMRARSHILMSVSGTVGATDLKSAADRLNTASHQGPGAAQTISAHADLVLREIGRVKAHLLRNAAGTVAVESSGEGA
jgi:CheY-like chemotaxis protein